MNRLALLVLVLPSAVVSPLVAAEQRGVLYADDFATMSAGWGKSSDTFFVLAGSLSHYLLILQVVVPFKPLA